MAPTNALGLLFVKLKGLNLLACVFDEDEIEQLVEDIRDCICGEIQGKADVFRTRPDLFALILPGLFCREIISIVMQKLRSIIDRPHTIEGRQIRLCGHIGVSVLENRIDSNTDLIKEARSALYDACKSNLPYVIYDRAHTERADYHLSLISELAGALDNDEFFLVYQPQLNLCSGLIESGEALIRWANRKYGLILPERFIPVAEKQGMITRISEWVIDNAVRYQSELEHAGLDLLLSVNLSASDLQNASLPDYIGQSLSIWNVSPNRLALEITEGSMIRSIETVLPLLHTLKDMGLRLAVDDFGTGYSSLKYIKDLPVNELKLDKTFVKNLPSSVKDRKIVRTVASLADNFGFRIVAEGVESREALKFLEGSGYHKIQGFYLSRPLSEHDFVQFIQEFNSGRMDKDPASR